MPRFPIQGHYRDGVWQEPRVKDTDAWNPRVLYARRHLMGDGTERSYIVRPRWRVIYDREFLGSRELRILTGRWSITLRRSAA